MQPLAAAPPVPAGFAEPEGLSLRAILIGLATTMAGWEAKVWRAAERLGYAAEIRRRPKNWGRASGGFSGVIRNRPSGATCIESPPSRRVVNT
jgi:hypothetical protein